MGVDDIGLHLLDAKAPLAPPAKEHTQVKVDPKIYDGYVGTYQLAPNFIITITRDGDHLFAQATGQPKFEIFPESERDFFLKVVDAQITFETDSTGRATELILHQNGRDVHGKRFEGEPLKPPEHKEATVDPKIIEGYVGNYQLAPGVVLVVTRDADHLYAQLTGQQTFEIFPEGKQRLFLQGRGCADHVCDRQHGPRDGTGPAPRRHRPAREADRIAPRECQEMTFVGLVTAMRRTSARLKPASSIFCANIAKPSATGGLMVWPRSVERTTRSGPTLRTLSK